MKLLIREPTKEMLAGIIGENWRNAAVRYWHTMYDAAPEMEPVAWQVIAKNGGTTGPTVRDMDELAALPTCLYDPEIDTVRELFAKDHNQEKIMNPRTEKEIHKSFSLLLNDMSEPAMWSSSYLTALFSLSLTMLSIKRSENYDEHTANALLAYMIGFAKKRLCGRQVDDTWNETDE